jgi:hypothetical protein
MDTLRSSAGHLIRLPEAPVLDDPLGPAWVAVTQYPEGESRSWFVGHVWHRSDGPAYENRGLRLWKQFGQLHREEGPAYEHGRIVEFYLRDVKFHWALPHALWGVRIVRNNLLDKAKQHVTFDEKRKHRQRSKALRLLRQHADEIDGPSLRAIVAEALSNDDPNLRRWGQQVAGLLGTVGA